MFDLDNLRVRVRQRSVTAMGAAAPKLQKALRKAAPVDTGFMAQMTTVSAVKRTLGGSSVATRVGAPYASYTVPPGTPPHIIRPVRAKALRFFWPVVGRVVFFAKVNHPGSPGTRWYADVIESWPKLVETELRNL